MRRFIAVFAPLVLVFLALLAVSHPARAEESKMVGSVEKITLAADGNSALVILKDTKSGQDVELLIEDTLTLDKLKDHRINTGDEIRCKYETKDGKNKSTYFRKTAGC
jgi:hypothetical protein